MKIAIHAKFFAALAAHATTLADGDDAGTWVQLIPAGEFSGRDGRGPFRAGDAAAMAKIVASTLKTARGTDLVIDYDHQSVFATRVGVGRTALAAGWIKEIEVRANGIWGRVEWTDRAAAHIKAREYRYLSPVFEFAKSGAITRIVNAALTNSPNLELAEVSANSATSQHESESMDKILKALGLSEGSDEAAVLAAIEKMQADLAKLGKAAGAKDGAGADEILAAVNSARTEIADPTKYVPIAAVEDLQKQLAAMQTSLSADRAEEAVTKAIADGKLIPAMRTWGLSLHKADPAQFQAYVASAPVLTAPQLKDSNRPAAAPVLDDTDTAVMQQMGLDPAAMLAARKKESI